MSAPLPHLQATLSDRYTIERELGRGGMATVYLAQDLKHHRPVALKVLHPNLAAVLGAERFLREIETAANLNHPHILPLFDSGAGGAQGSELLWYAMPLVDGESLRDRLDRDTQLPVADALRITREVADALGYAHSRGIVHRDIKPENILLAHGHALVADFGIARAIGAAGGTKLTETGLALGTPSYMSPEQALGEAVDARSDIYALGCVLYEMLAGEPPYTGPTAQAILARRLSLPMPSLATIRDHLPPSLERTLQTALARTPADRFATASEFVASLNAPEGAARRRRVIGRPSRRLGVGLIVGLLAVAAIAAVHWWPTPPLPLDNGLVAVVPFRVAGNDPALAIYHEGMVDLMVTKLNGETGPRAVDPRMVMRLWNRQREGRPDVPDEEVIGLARKMGAGSVMLGSIIGTPGRLILSAAVLDVATGRTRHQATVEGVEDSLPWLADRLAVELLALDAGVESQRLASLTSASLPAVKDYLNGRSDMRAGRFTAAIERFNQALELDSTFALAAMNLAVSSGWGDFAEFDRGLGLAWAARNHLSLRDRSLLTARMQNNLKAWQDFVQKYPDLPEGWSALGDKYYHIGALTGLADAPERALAAFRRAIALDPDTTGAPYAEPMMHLADLVLITGDTAGAVRLLSSLLKGDSTGQLGRLQLALAELSGDTAKAEQLRRGFARMNWQELVAIIFAGQQNETQILDAQPALEAIRHMDEAPPDVVRRLAHDLALNRGRPQDALAGGFAGDPFPRGDLRTRISDALYWGGDTRAASRAADSLGRLVAQPPPSDRELRPYYYDLCLLEQWRLAHDDLRTAPGSIARLRTAARVPQIEGSLEHERCADLLDVWYTVVARKPDALQRLLRMDSLLTQESDPSGPAIDGANLIMSRLWRMRGDWTRAEAAARRRYVGLMPIFLSTHLLETGRAAAQAGHREIAIRALRHYLALRYDPEPAVRPEVEQVRAELAQLVAEPR